MRLLVSLLALATAGNAWAGGIGLLTTGGVHTERVWFYDRSDNHTQHQMTQIVPSYGTGLEVVLGDRQDRVIGLFRAYWEQHAAQQDLSVRQNPAGVSRRYVVANVRDTPRDVGMASVGVQWGFLGSPDALMVTAVGSMGSGFLTVDKNEFFQVEAGGGVAYNFGRAFQAHGNLVYQGRFRKGWSHGPNVYAGIRYMFD